MNLLLPVRRLLFIMLWLHAAATAQTIHITVDAVSAGDTISPYIYGANDSYAYACARRLGGNRLTGYNWENNASNSGSDAGHSNDDWLPWHFGVPAESYDSAAAVVSHFHEQSLDQEAYTLVTLPMAGFVAKDKEGTVAEEEMAPSSRWARVVNRKGSPWEPDPDRGDDSIFVDEELNYLIHRYGSAATGSGIKGYALDNEPCLWFVTHPRIWGTERVSVEELMNRSFDLAATVKDMDEAAEVFGPGLYGVTAYHNLQFAPDWESVKGEHDFFIEYYLEKMKLQSEAADKRLLDVLDLHWYPETNLTYGASPFDDGNDIGSVAARLEMTRSFWDSTYVEDTWIGAEHAAYLLPLIPKMNRIIDTNYPGTKFAITEYSFMGLSHISGAVAQADALGAFGANGLYMANYWGAVDGYIKTGFDLYRNYDGGGSSFGNISVPAVTDNRDITAVYASRQEGAGGKDLHIIAINRSMEEAADLDIGINGENIYTSASVYFADSSTYSIQHLDNIEAITGNHFSYRLPPMSIAHFILERASLSVPASPFSYKAGYVYPNPSSGMFYIDAAPEDFTAIEVTDIKGKCVRQAKVTAREPVVINMEQCAYGPYLIKLFKPDGSFIAEKVIYAPGR